jgi:hypothetical protein
MHAEDKEIAQVKEFNLQQLSEEIKAGKVDPVIVDILGQLNKISGVATLYACQGHKDHGSPMAFLYLVVSKRKEAILHKHLWPFIKYAPFFLTVEFEYSIDTHVCPQLYTRVKFDGDVEYIGEACLPMFHYIHDFFVTIGSNEAIEPAELEK